MVKIALEYTGGLHTVATHGPSGRSLETDAPVDNHGRGESFSPTDLVATENHGINLTGMRIEVGKEMTQTPPRRIARLTTEIWLPAGIKKDAALERAALTCPVHASLHPEVEKPITFHYEGEF